MTSASLIIRTGLSRLHRSRRRLAICALLIIALGMISGPPPGVLGALAFPVALLGIFMPVAVAIAVLVPRIRLVIELVPMSLLIASFFAEFFPGSLISKALADNSGAFFLVLWAINMACYSLLYGRAGQRLGRLRRVSFASMSFVRLPRETVVAMDCHDPALPAELADPQIIERRQLAEGIQLIDIRHESHRRRIRLTVEARSPGALLMRMEMPDTDPAGHEATLTIASRYATEGDYTRRETVRSFRNLPAATALFFWIDDLQGRLDDAGALDYERRVSSAPMPSGPVALAA